MLIENLQTNHLIYFTQKGETLSLLTVFKHYGYKWNGGREIDLSQDFLEMKSAGFNCIGITPNKDIWRTFYEGKAGTDNYEIIQADYFISLHMEVFEPEEEALPPTPEEIAILKQSEEQIAHMMAYGLPVQPELHNVYGAGLFSPGDYMQNKNGLIGKVKELLIDSGKLMLKYKLAGDDLNERIAPATEAVALTKYEAYKLHMQRAKIQFKDL